MIGLMRLTPQTVKVCFKVSTSHCCADDILDITRFSVDVLKEGCSDRNFCESINAPDSVIITYPVFELNDKGAMCIILDNHVKELCPGRYVFRIMLDQCVEIEELRFQWGATPVVSQVSCETSTAGDCYDEMGMTEDNVSNLPDSCCDPCPEPECDPCEKKPTCCD